MDEEFNREEKKFVNLEKAMRTLVRDISMYLEQLQVKLYCMCVRGGGGSEGCVHFGPGHLNVFGTGTGKTVYTMCV